jgi:hypothetical protein
MRASIKNSSPVVIIRGYAVTVVGICLTPNQWRGVYRLLVARPKIAEGSSENRSKLSKNGAFLSEKQVVFESSARHSADSPTQIQP